METVRQDIRYALLSLARSPGFTIVAALRLALGIRANSTMSNVIGARRAWIR